VAFHQVNPSLHWQILVSVICLNDLRPSNRTMLKPWQNETHSDPGVYVVGLPVPKLSTVYFKLTGGSFVNLLLDLELRLSFILELKTLKTDRHVFLKFIVTVHRWGGQCDLTELAVTLHDNETACYKMCISQRRCCF
jgi:hypothetical protein